MNSKGVLVAIAVVVPMLLGSCSSSSSTDTATTTATAPATTETPATDAPSTEAPSTEASATEAAATDAPSTEAPSATTPIELRGDGIADVHLGDDAEPAIARLIELLGQPASDGGWVAQESPCENMGSRSRTLSWDNLVAVFATGPTEFVPKATDHMSAYLLLSAGAAGADAADLSRFVLSDGKPALGRTLAELQAWDPTAQRFDSEIEGPVWSAGSGDNELSGSVSTESPDGSDRTSSVRAGLFCID